MTPDWFNASTVQIDELKSGEEPEGPQWTAEEFKAMPVAIKSTKTARKRSRRAMEKRCREDEVGEVSDDDENAKRLEEEQQQREARRRRLLDMELDRLALEREEDRDRSLLNVQRRGLALEHEPEREGAM